MNAEVPEPHAEVLVDDGRPDAVPAVAERRGGAARASEEQVNALGGRRVVEFLTDPVAACSAYATSGARRVSDHASALTRNRHGKVPDGPQRIRRRVLACH